MKERKNGDMIAYDLGVMQGNGKIVGVALEHVPPIGKTWIVQRIEDSIDSSEYDYDCIVVPEIMILDKQVVNDEPLASHPSPPFYIAYEK